MNNGLPSVALIGRVNVGKSTLFNRLVESEIVLTSNLPGTTRDRIERVTEWRGKSFRLMDSGGFLVNPKSEIEREILKQTERAIQTADVIVWVVDGKMGKHALEETLAVKLRQQSKPVILCVNKIEHDRDRLNTAGEFESLGFTPIQLVSAYTGVGTGDLLDLIVDRLPETPTESYIRKPLRLTFVGKPNVGKSSLINRILNDERVIVSELPHTTRESQDIAFAYDGRPITLVDTAGIHPVKKLLHNIHLAFSGKLEAKGMKQSENAIASSDVVAFVIESHAPLSVQDFRIADLIAQYPSTAVMIVANKWDLLEEKTTTSVKKFTETLHRVLPMLPKPPVLCVSAVERQRVQTILSTAIELHQRLHRTIPPEDLREFLREFTATHVLRSNISDGRRKPLDPPIFYSLKQTQLRPRVFTLSYQAKIPLPSRYMGQLRNALVERFDLTGMTIQLQAKK